ncbi:transmembrane protein, putative (macronuclear) [Tetrahymena thermophila SB210]|uniref:Transmembrane protein, putative n=1 Tax=Tetrahymena thermophila (strain SB210) TaxID=312017 RepID=W7XI78_TETTS|nr:transmembrane protein, putative [Tetrahymena thermophila SB210]EWS73074.1 transmembrane protein, putative [Tetrahymena thermophila SB210]|eukprot:XP_012654383.1 transmembrane protein, putative [Tetrahymena thermophila SB210]
MDGYLLIYLVQNTFISLQNYKHITLMHFFCIFILILLKTLFIFTILFILQKEKFSQTILLRLFVLLFLRYDDCPQLFIFVNFKAGFLRHISSKIIFNLFLLLIIIVSMTKFSIIDNVQAAVFFLYSKLLQKIIGRIYQLLLYMYVCMFVCFFERIKKQLIFQLNKLVSIIVIHSFTHCGCSLFIY